MQALAEALERAGLPGRLEGGARLFVPTPSGELLIKPVSPAHLAERAFFTREAFDGLVLHAGGRVFSHAGETYEAITLQPDLRPVEGPEAALGVRELYRHANRISVLGPAATVEDLIARDHIHWDVDKPQAHREHGRPPLAPAIEAFWTLAEPLRPANPERFRTGVFHEDLQVGNILVAPDGTLHIIDPDPVWHAPAVMNLAHFLVMAVLAEQKPERLEPLRAAMLEVLEEERPEDFDFFVLLALFRVLVRRAFHADYFHSGWSEDLRWYLEAFGDEQYLARVRR